MNQKSMLKFFWIAGIIIIPVFIELVITSFVAGLYVGFVIFPLWIAFQLPLPSFISWIPPQLGQKFSILLLVVSIYFALAWLAAIYKYFKYGDAIPKSLIFWHKEWLVYVRSIPQKIGWKRTELLAFVLTLLLSVLWWYFSQNQFNSDQVALIKDSLNKTEKQLLSIKESNEQLRNQITNNKINDLEIEANNVINNVERTLESLNKDNSREIIENNISEVSGKISEIKEKVIYEMKILGSIENSLTNNDGQLKGLVKNLEKLQVKVQSICVYKEGKQNSECQFIRPKITQNQNHINEFQFLTNEFKNNELLSLKSSYEQLVKIRGSLAKTEQQIEEAKGKYLFNAEEINIWLTSTEKELTKITDEMSNFSIDNYNYEINQIPTRFSNNDTATSKIQESTLKLENQNLWTRLNESNSNKKSLFIIEKDNQQIISNLELLYHEIKSEIETLKEKKLKVYGFAYQAHSYLNRLRDKNSQDKYKTPITTIKDDSNQLFSKLTQLIKQYENTLDRVKSQKEELQPNIGELSIIIKEMQSKNKRILNESRITVALGFMPIMAIIVIIWLVLKNIGEKRELDEIERLNASNTLESFIEYATNSKKTLKIRLYAVQKISNQQTTITEKEINELRSLIKKLGKSRFNNDLEVASKLIKVVEELEIRAAEKRSF